ncbi:hypothetical protein JL100_006685 [Skermanella mucosa]|uniref:hypothetical protein n=1 Tax=Skermanella mucosa TaxID=1789672 RepID=UPI00192AE0EA|nr:hypothetical protein [Skermanella mucosa]UEM22428.1 hypothetical protein JL100_006685 [Skermanella mucosa]
MLSKLQDLIGRLRQAMRERVHVMSELERTEGDLDKSLRRYGKPPRRGGSDEEA